MLEELSDGLKKLQEGLDEKKPGISVNNRNSFLFADDSAYAFKFRHSGLKWILNRLKLFYKQLMVYSRKWGLNLNHKKSALMLMHNQTTKFGSWSDAPVVWDKRKQQTTLLWNLGDEGTVELPMVKYYKYLGIFFKYNLSFDKHLEFLRKKSSYITYSFTSFRKHSQSVKFCHNIWVTFIRPLLDSSMSYVRFSNVRGKEKLFTLYRTTLKSMLFFQNYIPNIFLNSLIQYDYKGVPEEYYKVSKTKWDERRKEQQDFNMLYMQVNFNYRKFDLSKIPPGLVKIMNVENARANKLQVILMRISKKNIKADTLTQLLFLKKYL